MTPGPDLALITRLVLTRSSQAGVAGAFGMITAGAAQAALGALGLTVLFSQRPYLFTAFQWFGAGLLLVWAAFALRAALHPEPPSAPPGDPSPSDRHDDHDYERDHDHEHPTRRAYAQGLLCTGSNPKVGMFLVAFLPQFAPKGLDPTLGVVILATCYLSLGLAWLLAWTRLVHLLARHLYSARVIRLMHWLTAAVFSGFALRLALWG